MIPYCILIIEDDNDRSFMEDLFTMYGKLMYNEIHKILSNSWTAEDVMQSALINLIDKISFLRTLERDPFVNYIISTSKNTARNYIRDHKLLETPYDNYIDTADDDSDSHSLELHILKKEEMERLKKVWPQLSTKNKHLLEGYYILEKSMPELATELGLNPNSVRAELSRARKAAYKLLKNEET